MNLNMKQSNMLEESKEITIKVPSIPEDRLIRGQIKLCDVDDIKYLEGRLKTMIDAAVKQNIKEGEIDPNKAMKDVIYSIVWDFWKLMDLSRKTSKEATYLLYLEKLQNE